VEAINNRLRLRVWMRNSGQAVFAVHDILMAPQVDKISCPWPRNSYSVSAWYAWYVLVWPEVALHRHKQSRGPDQTQDLLAVLFDFWHIRRGSDSGYMRNVELVGWRASRPGESHPQALLEPCLK